jgi:NADH dehydrogenase
LIVSKNVVWASGVVANGEAFFDEALLEKGRVMVKATLQVPGHPEAFVIGDLAAVKEGNGPHPQTAQAAFEQAKFSARNLKKLVMGEPLGAFYYHHKGDLVPIGDRWAIAEIHGMRFSGFLGWWLRRTVYLSGLFTWASRFQVVFDWTMRLFTYRDTTRL